MAPAGRAGMAGSLLASVRRLRHAQRLALGGAALAATVVAGFVIVQLSSSRMTLLYADLKPGDIDKIAATLDGMKVHYELRAGGEIYVLGAQLELLRRHLAQEGLPSDSGISYEIFQYGNDR
jgi:flagellar M-ring protein FliF